MTQPQAQHLTLERQPDGSVIFTHGFTFPDNDQQVQQYHDSAGRLRSVHVKWTGLAGAALDASGMYDLKGNLIREDGTRAPDLSTPLLDFTRPLPPHALSIEPGGRRVLTPGRTPTQSTTPDATPVPEAPVPETSAAEARTPDPAPALEVQAAPVVVPDLTPHAEPAIRTEPQSVTPAPEVVPGPVQAAPRPAPLTAPPVRLATVPSVRVATVIPAPGMTVATRRSSWWTAVPAAGTVLVRETAQGTEAVSADRAASLGANLRAIFPARAVD